MKRVLYLLIFFLVVSNATQATICTNIASGNWATAANWTCGHMPTCGDTVIIKAGTTVSVTSAVNYYTGCTACATSACNTTCTAKMFIIVNGNWYFTTGGGKLDFPCCTQIFVGATGTITPAGNGNSSNIWICNAEMWRAQDGPVPAGGCFPPGCSALPIELINFSGEEKGNVVYLKWKTASETNSDRYEVEKSVDGVNFETVLEVPSKSVSGNSKVALEYSATDSDLRHSLYYYRLKQVDKNGDFSLTNMISVTVRATELSIFPNPNSGSFHINVPNANSNEQLIIKIYSVMGNLVYESTEYLKTDNVKGSTISVAPTQALPKGVYMSAITVKGETHNLKLVVE